MNLCHQTRVSEPFSKDGHDLPLSVNPLMLTLYLRISDSMTNTVFTPGFFAVEIMTPDAILWISGALYDYGDRSGLGSLTEMLGRGVVPERPRA